MCTAIGYKNNGKYFFGRTLDVCASYGENTVVAPRNFPLLFKVEKRIDNHHAIMGTAIVAGGLPLYYDAMNEKGLCMAGLNFPQNAVYHPVIPGKVNLAPFEIIPYILGRCATVAEARKELKNISIADISFSKEMPHTPLHWIIGDKSGEIVVESQKDGLKVHENPAGVLTNNPPFEAQLFNLKNYARLSTRNPENTFGEGLDMSAYSRGMGALGMPGDWSSPSRFVRAAFVKFNYSAPAAGGTAHDLLRMLDAVFVPKGCVDTDEGYQYTVYSCCCDTAAGRYFVKDYEGKITYVDFAGCNLDGGELF